jgi:polo-like kinase 1
MKASLKRTRAREKLKSEIAIHRSLNHERIVGFMSVFEIDKYVVIVLQLARGGTLMDTVKREKRLSERVARNFAQEILEGIKYLHAERVIHRDLKLGNLMLDENDHVLLGDFGLSTRLSTMEEKKFTLCGTPNYLAPEILSKSRSGHSFTADIFSFGCIIYTLVVGRPPFQSRSVKETYARIRSGTWCSSAKRENLNDDDPVITIIPICITHLYHFLKSNAHSNVTKTQVRSHGPPIYTSPRH